MSQFTPEKLTKIKTSIDQCLERAGSHPIAAFDADGTLWECDLGELLFEYQIKNGLVEGLNEEALQQYEEMRRQPDPRPAFLWLAQVNAGLPIEQIRQWAQEALNELGEPPLIPAVKEIIDHLHNSGVTTYVVTASVKWSVEPGASLYNIPSERVIGVNTKIKEGVITEEQHGPITYKEGKVEALMQVTQGKHPFFCAGNTEGDLPLLESASDLRLVLATAPEGHDNFDTEQQMQALARERNWFFHSYL